MGTRYFSPVEEKSSRIKWEQADVSTAEKLAVVIHKYSYGLVTARVARIVVFLPGVFLLALLVGFLYLFKNNYSRIVNSVEIVFYMFYLLSIVFFAEKVLPRELLALTEAFAIKLSFRSARMTSAHSMTLAESNG